MTTRLDPAPVEVSVDVSEALGLGETLHTRATVTLPHPDTTATPPVVCFGFPGGGYGRRYFTFDMPGASAGSSGSGGQAGWHARRGWVFVSCDHPYVGESDAPSEPDRLTLRNVAAANAATVAHVRSLLEQGTLRDGFPALRSPVVLGIGQSMGGCFTVVQQANHATYDGIGVLGFSGLHTVLPMPPAASPDDSPFLPRDDGLPVITWGFHYDDLPADVVDEDMRGYPTRDGTVPVWGSATVPPCAAQMVEAGCVAAEAAAVTVPVFVGVGERDVCPDPHAEPSAYRGSHDVTLVVCPRMAHMHNFASTRERLWARLHSWGDAVAAGVSRRA